MIVLAIDPGTKQSGYVVYDTEKQEILAMHILLNNLLPVSIKFFSYYNPVKGEELNIEIDVLVYEGMNLYHAVSEDTIQTLIWCGEFRGVFKQYHWDRCRKRVKGAFVPMPEVHEIKRSAIRKHFEVKNDSGIRVALIDRFGGSRSVAVGTKKQKGKLYGVKSHIWSALAVAICYAETTGANSE